MADFYYLGLIRGSQFVRYTNFDIEVLFSATTPTGISPPLSGFVFLVRSTDGMERLVLISHSSYLLIEFSVSFDYEFTTYNSSIEILPIALGLQAGSRSEPSAVYRDFSQSEQL